MIIGLKFSNWKSFAQENVFSAVTSGKRLLDRVPQFSIRPSVRVSPVSVFFGGNASGKSNFVSFLRFLQKLICDPVSDENDKMAIFLQGNKFNSAEQPLSFELTFLASESGESRDETVYTYKADILPTEILRESLERLNSKTGEFSVVFSRENQNITLNESVFLEEDRPQADAIRVLINRNQAFLAKGGRKLKTLSQAYHWFSQQLLILDGDSTHVPAWYTEKENLQASSRNLAAYDTGISELFWENVSFSELPAELRHIINDALLKEHYQKIEIAGDSGMVYMVIPESSGKSPHIEQLSTRHQTVNFGIENESFGTRRLIELLPFLEFLCMPRSNKVIVIDELGRNWHYLLTRTLIQNYLANCSRDTRSQLLLTTHDLMLMDQTIFRLSEIWLTTREKDGASTLATLGESGIRYDKDIRKMYLDGRLRGIPRILNTLALSGKRER